MFWNLCASLFDEVNLHREHDLTVRLKAKDQTPQPFVSAALGVDGLATVFRPEAQRLGGRLGRLVRNRDLLHDLEKLAVRAIKTLRQLKI